MMKRFVFAALVAMVGIVPVLAQQTVKTLVESENGIDVTWSKTLSIEPEKFAGDVNVGDYIYITFSRTTDVIELKANGTWLPGTLFTFLGDNTTDYRTYITEDALTALTTYGLEICGADFSVKSVSICNDGFSMPEGAVWGGYFWVDEWDTMNLFKTAFDSYAGQRYMDIYLSADNGTNTGYFMKVLTKWDPETVVAGNDAIVHETTRAVVDLKEVNLVDALSDVNALMIQSNPEGGAPYNITAVVLRNDGGTNTAVDEVMVSPVDGYTEVYNMQGILVRKAGSYDEAVLALPAGIYIVNGCKIAVR